MTTSHVNFNYYFTAPISSPCYSISSWVGFEVGLINDQLVIIQELVAAQGGTLTIKDTGFAIFLQSIKYRYYPIFMLVMVMFVIGMQRDFGPMLLAERQVRVYDRTDGGPNHGKDGEIEGAAGNQPRDDQPLLAINMLIPVLVLVVLIFIALVVSGDDGSGTQTFMEKIESSDSYIALLYGVSSPFSTSTWKKNFLHTFFTNSTVLYFCFITRFVNFASSSKTMGTAWISIVMYLCQITIPGTAKLCWPTPKVLYDMLPWRKDQVEVQPRFLMSVPEAIESFLFGMTRIFLALVVLTLAWASGDIMSYVGADRLFAAWIVGGIDPQLLPTLSFLISLLMALATGTSWGTMSILFPLILVPTYISSDGDPLIFYAVVAGVLSGSVAGDHMSPISDTTVLSALACDVTLVAHVSTQAPYVLISVLCSVIFGTLPIGYDAWPNMVGIALGWVVLGLFVYFVCAPVISPTGRWDPFFKYCCGRRHDKEFLDQLTEDCIKKANGEHVEMKGEDEILDSLMKEVAPSGGPGGDDESNEPPKNIDIAEESPIDDGDKPEEEEIQA